MRENFFPLSVCPATIVRTRARIIVRTVDGGQERKGFEMSGSSFFNDKLTCHQQGPVDIDGGFATNQFRKSLWLAAFQVPLQ